jgi:hypothetical protein
MYKTISNKIIREFNPCYDPSKFITDENEELPIKDWVHKYRDIVPSNDIIWLLLRKEFMSEKDLILFVVWCAREALKLVENPDHRSIEACDVAERYANGEATKEELYATYIAADDVAAAAYNTAHAAYFAATAAAASSTAYYASYAASTTVSAANAARDAVNAARDVANATRDRFNIISVVYSAANAAYFAAFADRDTVSRVDNSIYAYAVADAAISSQLDKLLTYFE